ncbi:MAG: thrombospondin type 3 repeat-containing protein [Candidatus Komeilibacteria bacterium]|nr:thrombospondin type 3 repeat-containing protein [Candidatus Komeilibacteria bacterium]
MKKFLLPILFSALFALSGCSIPGISQKATTENQTAQEKIICDLNNNEQDCDNDGLSNLQEKNLGTNPQKADSDGDGYSDGDEVKNGYNPLVAGGKLETPMPVYNAQAITVSSPDKKINFIYQTKIDKKIHVILNGNDLGTISTSTNSGGPDILQGNDTVFLRDFPTGKINERGREIIEKHIIFNGKDMGIGYGPSIKIAKGNIIFVTNPIDRGHVIFNGRDLGETHLNDGVTSGSLTENEVYLDENGNFAYLKNINGKEHVIYNDKDMGEGDSGSIQISNNNIAFTRVTNPKGLDESRRHIIYNGKDLGPGDNPAMEGKNFAYWTFDRVLNSYGLYDNKGKIIYNGKDLGPGYGETIQLFKDNIVFIKGDFSGKNKKIVLNGKVIGDFDDYGEWPETFENHVVYERKIDNKSHVFMDGQDLGLGKVYTFAYSEGNYAFERQVGSVTRIIYNGKDLGEGEQVQLSGKDIIFLRKSDMHIIYNDKDLGEGKSPHIAGDNFAYIKDTDYYSTSYTDHLIFNGKDIGPGFGPQFSYSN